MSGPYIEWHIGFAGPKDYRNLADWFLFYRKGAGTTVVRVLGLTVRIVK